MCLYRPDLGSNPITRAMVGKQLMSGDFVMFGKRATFGFMRIQGRKPKDTHKPYFTSQHILAFIINPWLGVYLPSQRRQAGSISHIPRSCVAYSHASKIRVRIRYMRTYGPTAVYTLVGPYERIYGSRPRQPRVLPRLARCMSGVAQRV